MSLNPSQFSHLFSGAGNIVSTNFSGPSVDMTDTDRVRVYRNLHKNALSLQRRIPGVGWRVSEHAPEVTVRNAEFNVNQAGRERVLKEKRKNVHATVTGTPMAAEDAVEPTERVRYNPYEDPTFVDEAGEPVHRASVARIAPSGIWIAR